MKLFKVHTQNTGEYLADSYNENKFQNKKDYKTKTDKNHKGKKSKIKWLHNHLKHHYVRNTIHKKI